MEAGVPGKSSNVFWCKNCLNMSTRPRITFDDRGWCNACQWMEEKRTLDWEERNKELVGLLDKYRTGSGKYDCLVPVSGGKDGSYVAYQLRHKYGMNPLTVTVRPPLTLTVGDENLQRFIDSGYPHIHITPDPSLMKQINKYGFTRKGSPYFGWLTSIFTSVLRTAVNYSIPLIFYGEDGEIEYGGSTETKERSIISYEYMKRVYLEGGYEDIAKYVGEDQWKRAYFWLFPGDSELNNREIYATHWSYYEPWDSYRNYLVAKKNCGLKEQEDNSSGTFTNFAQSDQALYPLHAYLMYLKFGFGRATQDAGIEIRRGAMNRSQAINLVRLYDGEFPSAFIDLYLDYFQMTLEEFNQVLDHWANKDLFEKVDGEWRPTFTII
jgi:N-acetyl sugar amidotransferase